MINKTFNSHSTDGRALEVGRNGERPWLNIREFDLENTMFMLAPSDAPALALAILEAAGVEPTFDPNATFGTAEQLGHIQDHLHEYVNAQERAAAEAKEQAELEAEALELFNISQGTNLGAWAPRTDRSVINIWVEIAKRAREIAGRAEK